MCGASCGTCTDGTCNADGQCEAVSEHAPRILSFTTNVGAITRGQSVTFSAIVTDPDGLADIVGGTLEGSSGQVYGTFSASGGAGAYSMPLSWNDMHLVAPIEFISTFLVRPFSLTVRLFANLLAGHILLVTFSLLTEELVQGDSWILKPVGVLPFFMLMFITAFEVLVGFLQAYIFTILAAVYIGGAAHPEH